MDLRNETGRHVYLAFAKNSGDTQDQTVLRAQFRIVNVECVEELVIILFHPFAARLSKSRRCRAETANLLPPVPGARYPRPEISYCRKDLRLTFFAALSAYARKRHRH